MVVKCATRAVRAATSASSTTSARARSRSDGRRSRFGVTFRLSERWKVTPKRSRSGLEVGGGAVELTARRGERALGGEQVGRDRGVGCVVVVRGDGEHPARQVVDLRSHGGQLGPIRFLAGGGHAGA